MPTSAHRHFANWLRRTRRQLAPSGRLSEAALILSQREGGTPEWHAERLRAILDEKLVPSLDELTTIDRLLARPGNSPANIAEPPPLL